MYLTHNIGSASALPIIRYHSCYHRNRNDNAETTCEKNFFLVNFGHSDFPTFFESELFRVMCSRCNPQTNVGKQLLRNSRKKRLFRPWPADYCLASSCRGRAESCLMLSNRSLNCGSLDKLLRSFKFQTQTQTQIHIFNQDCRKVGQVYLSRLRSWKV